MTYAPRHQVVIQVFLRFVLNILKPKSYFSDIYCAVLFTESQFIQWTKD